MSSLFDDARAVTIQTVYRPYRTYGSARYYEDLGDAYGKGDGGGLSADSIAAIIGAGASILSPVLGKQGKKAREHEADMMNQQLEIARLQAAQRTKLYLGLGFGAMVLLGAVVLLVRR